MTGRERILAAFNGGRADLVPFAPNIYLWFYYHRYHGTLPDELQAATHPFDVLRHLGADILARWDTQWAVKEVYSAGEYRSEFVDQGGVPAVVSAAGRADDHLVQHLSARHQRAPATLRHTARHADADLVLHRRERRGLRGEVLVDRLGRIRGRPVHARGARLHLRRRAFPPLGAAGGRRRRGHVPHHAVAA